MNISDAQKTLEKLKQCAIEAKIYHAWFISFGTLLGAIRPTFTKWGHETRYMRGIMSHDNDMDVSILSDKITIEQENHYVSLIRDAGLYKSREEYQYRDDTNRLLWTSLRGHKAPAGTKCCNWFWQKHKDYYWHSKGLAWVSNKFPKQVTGHENTDKAIMLGIPETYLSDLVEIDFIGGKYNIPVMYGHCLDWWYPEWIVPKKGGTSARKIHCVVKNWENVSDWKIC